MTSIPSNLNRLPTLLATQIAQSQITSAGLEMLRLQEQLTTGKRLNRPSDDPVATSLVSVLSAREDAAAQRLRNMDHASSALATLDSALGRASDLTLEAKSIASSQLGVGSDAETRRSQAVVVQSLLNELLATSRTEFADIHLFGGVRTGADPVEAFRDGFRYVGVGDGLRTDLGGDLDAPITIGADHAFGSLSTRVQGDVDLDPALGDSTKLDSIRGARGLGIGAGQIEIDVFDGATTTTAIVDLTGLEDLGDVTDRIESAIRNINPAALAGAFPNGVTVAATGERIEIGATGAFTVDIRDIGAGTVAEDLGLTGFTYAAGSTENPAIDLDPKLSEFTTFASLNPAGGFTPGDIVFRNGAAVGSVTVTAGMTLGEFRSAVEGLGLGVRVEIGADGRTIDVVNEVSGQNLSIEESGGGTLTATALGIRSLRGTTDPAVFNVGRGVEIAHGEIDPITGLPDADRNVDFAITLSDGTTFDVDLVPGDLVDVNAVLARINAAATLAGVTVGAGPGEFQATLADGANGIALQDNLGGGGPVSVQTLNGHAADDLGLLDGTTSAGPPLTLTGEDRATVRVDSLFTALIELRDALENNDERGIAFAGERIEESLTRLARVRAEVGGRAARLEDSIRRTEDAQLLDQTIRSGLEDADYAQAASQFSLLQLVQQAGYTATSQAQSLTLLNFLG